MTVLPDPREEIRSIFGARLQEHVSLKRFTAARIGGEADFMVIAGSSEELAESVRACWQASIPFIILGGGSNVLVADAGVRELVILNQAKKSVVSMDAQPPSVWAESGANFGYLARKVAAHGLSGLEWAAGIPGTLGGAIYGNAGAHGSDMSTSLVVADILHLIPSNGSQPQAILREEWPANRFEYGYRASSLKRQPGRVVVLSAQLKVVHSTPEAVRAKIAEFRAQRRTSQPSGASLGSIFKNPPGDYAGRLIEAAGLKGLQKGKAQVSQKHANFIVSQDSASASDYAELIRLVRERVLAKAGVRLELEIELVGEWRSQ